MIDIVSARPSPSDPGVGLRAALAEAANARLERGLLEVAARLRDLSVDAPEDPLDELARRVAAMLRMEEIASAIGEDGAPGGAALERILTLQQIASRAAREVVTSLAARDLRPRVEAALAAAVAELVAMVEAETADRDAEVRLYLTSAWQGDEVILAFAARGVEDAPLSTEAGMRAFRRAERLVALIGGTLVRGFANGMLVIGMLVADGGRGGLECGG